MRAMEWLTAANIDGPGFVQIPEEEFKARLPEVFISFFLLSNQLPTHKDGGSTHSSEIRDLGLMK